MRSTSSTLSRYGFSTPLVWPVLWFAISPCQATPPQPEKVDEIVAAYLRDHRLEIRLTNGRLTGGAADWFRTAAAAAQFVFVGEEHDVREIPLIAGALWRELVPLGFKHVAIEAGPWLGERLDRFARFGDRDALAHFQAATWPRLPNNSVPPISQEDIVFYALLGRESGPHAGSEAPLIWGLDQEQRAAPLLRRLEQLAPATLAADIQLLRKRVEAAEQSGDFNNRTFRGDIQRIMRSMPATGHREQQQILEGLKWRSMEPSERGDRNVKKELFMSQYQAAKRHGESAPRILLRFGGYHAARGLMPDFGSSTLANFLAELAVAEGSRMFDVVFINCRGVSPGTFPRPCTWEQNEALKPFRAAAVAPWTLFDVRGLREPLRRARLNSLQSYPGGWQYWNLVMSFDAVVLLQESEPSHLPGLIPFFPEPVLDAHRLP